MGISPRSWKNWNIQIQYLLKLNEIGFMEKIFQSNNSNTTLVKVKWNTYHYITPSIINSNTTLVKVKFLLLITSCTLYPIQIQHLLKLNDCGILDKALKSSYSNTTLVKVKSK